LGLAYLSPSIVETLGYGKTKTQLLTVPPFAFAFVVTMVAAYLADRFKRHDLMAICTTCLVLVGFNLFLTNKTKAVKYTSLYFLITGISSSAPSMISWILNITAAHSLRATTVALGFVSTNIGGIINTWIYLKKSAPQYKFCSQIESVSCMHHSCSPSISSHTPEMEESAEGRAWKVASPRFGRLGG
jgi:sugar phosphate permease